MLETEDLGVSILHDLHSQRQSLLRADNAVFYLLKAHLICLLFTGSRSLVFSICLHVVSTYTFKGIFEVQSNCFVT